MALSWSELSADHKIVFLLESLVNENDQQAPIACRFCDKIFFNNKTLLNHFQSHFHQDGIFNGRSHGRSFVPPGNISDSISRSSQYANSLSVPVNVRNCVTCENIGACAWQNVSPKLPNLSLGNFSAPTLSQDSVQLTRATMTDRPPSYLSPSIFHSAVSHGTFASQPAGSLSFHSPIRSRGSEIFTSDTTRFPADPGTSGLALGTTRCLPQTARRNEVEGPLSGYTKPYIKQLERPIQGTIVVHDVDGDNNPDEMDLTLKL